MSTLIGRPVAGLQSDPKIFMSSLLMLLLSEPRPEQLYAAEQLLGLPTALLHVPMGHGKSLTVLYAYSVYLDINPDARLLFLTNKSNVPIVKQQLYTHFSKLPSVNIYLGPRRRLDMTASITIASYDVVAGLKGLNPTVIVLDEVHLLRNIKTLRFLNVLDLVNDDLELLWGLTGTPLVNNMRDLRPLAILSNETYTVDWARSIRISYESSLQLGELTSHLVTLEPNAAEISAYAAIELLQPAIVAFTKARVWAATVLCKLQYVLQMIAKHQKVVIFSSFKTAFPALMDIAKSILCESGTVFEITGDIPTSQRTNNIRAFANAKRGVFFLTYAAGDVGIDLSSADAIVLLDRPLTAASLQQAVARVRRPGFVGGNLYSLSCGRIDDRVDKIVQTKSLLSLDVAGNSK